MNRTESVKRLFIGSIIFLISIALVAWFIFRNLPIVPIFRDEQYWFITWKTHIAFALCVSVLLWLPFFLVYWFKRNALSKNLLLTATSVAILLFLVEGFFCVIPFGKTYGEKNQDVPYSSPFVTNPSIFYLPGTNTYRIKNADFDYSFPVNKLGFSGDDWILDNPKNKIRIFALGDSFTQGVGAPMDSSYPCLLQQILGNKYESRNAGVAGSDPVFGYKNMEKRLLPYKPDIVLQTVSENDIFFDFGPRGGFERFVGDSVLKFKDPPIYEPLYAISYVSRIFFEIFGLSPIHKWYYNRNVKSPKIIAERNQLLFDILNRYEKLATENHFEVRIVFLPMVSEMREGKYLFDFTPAKKHIATLQHVKYIDLMPCYQAKMQQTQELIDKYYWKRDKHHNSAGYELMARCIADELK